jgi:protein SCO1/2
MAHHEPKTAFRAWLPAVALLALGASGAHAQDDAAPEYANDATVGIDEKLGETIPLDLEFIDHHGSPVVLRDLMDKPTILTLVYLRCPSICSPLLHEVARAVDKSDVIPGEDYELITVSFDITDNTDLSSTARNTLLQEIEREMPADSWQFLTGEEDSIARLTDAVGFRFRREEQDFSHAGTVMFISPEGKIVRYLAGEKILPANFKMAVIDAADGRPRSLVQRLQKLCYAYDSEGQTYVLKANRIILLVTLPLVGLFLGVLLFKKKAPARS